jgi:hypothetical protein
VIDLRSLDLIILFLHISVRHIYDPFINCSYLMFLTCIVVTTHDQEASKLYSPRYIYIFGEYVNKIIKAKCNSVL